MTEIQKPRKKKFNVTGIENFDVIPLQKGREYLILEVSKDGTKWKAKDHKGRVGWIPAHYMRALGMIGCAIVRSPPFIFRS
jgi:hypothetical protein